MNTPLTDAIERHFKEKGEWDIQSLLSHSRSLEWDIQSTVEALNCARRERDEMAKIQPGGWAYFESRIEEAERRECTYRLRVEELQELYRKSEAKLDAAMRDVMRMVPQAIIDKTPIGESCVKQLALEYEAKSRECEELREVARNAAAVLDFLTAPQHLPTALQS